MANVQPTTKSFEELLNNSPLTKPMWLLWGLSAGLIALDGFDFFIIGIALPFLKKDFNLTSLEIGLIAVSAIAGSLFGSLILGSITDKIGRQKMLLIDVFIFIIASAGSALAWDTFSLIFFRFLVGIGIGADYPISVAYITENVPSRLRGKMVISAFTFQAIGALLGALTGILVINLSFIFGDKSTLWAIQYGWRYMLGIGLLFAIFVGFLRLQFLLESPSYYIAKGEYKLASDMATQLLNQPIKITPESEPKSIENQVNYSILFSEKYLKNTLLASLPWFLQDIATYGIGIFTPTIIAFLAFGGETDFLVNQIKSAQASALVDLFLIMGFIIAIFLVDKLGRISLQITGFIGMAMGLMILSFSGDNDTVNQTNLLYIFLGFFLFNLAMNGGPNSTTFLLSGEVFPPQIRATGAGFAGAIAKSGAILGAFLLPIIREKWGVTNVLYLLVIVCLLAGILTYLLRIDNEIKVPLENKN